MGANPPEPVPPDIQAQLDHGITINGWCIHCGADRLLTNALSRPCSNCRADYGLVAGPESLRPPRPSHVAIGKDTDATQTTLFDNPEPTDA